ncbi:hypothetical protein [Paraburkholderia terricola]|uniref:hypothetical protein n=1 Tax=Paraburkholderia terricola TaxID=169427 RepID=UPI003ECDAE94
MQDHICPPYRELGVHVRIDETTALSFNGAEPRYTVTWYVHKKAHFIPENVVASHAESLEFTCPEEAVAYGQRRAYTFVDCAFVVSRK